MNAEAMLLRVTRASCDAWSGFADSVQLTQSHRGTTTKQVPSAPRTWHRPVTPSSFELK
jgi:hypothetical protein